MKRKEKETVKSLSVGELKAELKQAREKQFNLSFKHSMTPVANPLEIRALRRKIAMLETFIQSKESVSAKAGAKKN